MCASLSPPTNGRVAYFTDSAPPYDYDTVATYTCDIGFGIAGGDVNSVCTDENNEAVGRWTRIPPTCERKFYTHSSFTRDIVNAYACMTVCE